jgi:phospholipid/cholesterol/gamma-HCH transport system permease protein
VAHLPPRTQRLHQPPRFYLLEGFNNAVKRRILSLQEFFILAGKAIGFIFARPFYGGDLVQQMDAIGVQSLAIVVLTGFFTGMVLALQTAVNMARFGAENYVGPVVALSILRELGPVLTAILVGGKVASGITAELGSMKVTEQIDALRALGVNYIKKLIVPRLLAALLVFPLVTILADGMGLLGGMLIAVFDRNVDPYLYWNTIAYWVVLKDFLSGLGKSFVFGGLVTLIGCYNGLATEGGTEGLGRSTTATVVQVAMGVIISDFFITRLFLFMYW